VPGRGSGATPWARTRPWRARSCPLRTARCARDDQRSPAQRPAAGAVATLADAIQWTGTWLVARGVRASDVVALHEPDHIEFIALRQTASRVGGVLVRLSPQPRSQQASGQPGRPGGRWLATTPDAGAQPRGADAALGARRDPFAQRPRRSRGAVRPRSWQPSPSVGIASQVAGLACPGRLAHASRPDQALLKETGRNRITVLMSR